MCRIVAEITGFEHEFVKLAKSDVEEYKTSTYSQGVFPYLKDESSGEGLGESLAIARFMCNSKPESGLYGSSTHETALVDEVIDRHMSALNQFAFKVVGSLIGYSTTTEEKFAEQSKKFNEYLSRLNTLLDGKEYFVSEKLTLADLYVCMSMNLLMATYIDAELRATLPNLTAWYERVRKNATVVSFLGTPRYIGQALSPKTE